MTAWQRSIAHVWYIKILTWLRGFRDQIANFSRLHCLAIPRRDLSTKKTKPCYVRILRYRTSFLCMVIVPIIIAGLQLTSPWQWWWSRNYSIPSEAWPLIPYNFCEKKLYRSFAWWRHFTTMTRVLQRFALLCKWRLLLFKSRWDYQIYIWKEKRKGFWSQL